MYTAWKWHGTLPSLQDKDTFVSLFTLISLEMLLGTEFSVGKKSFPQSTAGYVMPHLLFTLTINVKEDVIHKDPVR